MWFSSDFHKMNCMLRAGACLSEENIFNVSYIKKGPYMGAHVLLNLLNELRKRDKMRGLTSILSLFLNSFNKFNKTGA